MNNKSRNGINRPITGNKIVSGIESLPTMKITSGWLRTAKFSYPVTEEVTSMVSKFLKVKKKVETLPRLLEGLDNHRAQDNKDLYIDFAHFLDSKLPLLMTSHT